MRSAKLGGILGRMQRIRKQQESSRQSRVFGKKHTGLPAAIGMATQKQAPGRKRINRWEGRGEAGRGRGGAPRGGGARGAGRGKRKNRGAAQKTGRGKLLGPPPQARGPGNWNRLRVSIPARQLC